MMRKMYGNLGIFLAIMFICSVYITSVTSDGTVKNITVQKSISATLTPENKGIQGTLQINVNTSLVTNHTTANQETSLGTKILRLIWIPLNALLHAPKITTVLRNIGTCVVNGAMEIISYYLPAPLIPLITTTAGQMIPFEPIIMLRDKMPVASYRRAFITAIRSFLGTFDRYKLEENFEDDPYMMNQFNRRMMKYRSSEEMTKKSKKTK